MNAGWIFKGAVACSVAAHGALLVLRAAGSSVDTQRVVEIPVILETETEPPPPAPPPEPPKRKPRPRNLARHVDKVVESDGLRAAELTEAEVGDYAETQEAQAEPTPSPRPPPPVEPRPKPAPPPVPKVDRVKLARQFLQRVRNAIAGAKRYPFRAQRMGISGSVAVSLVIQPNCQFSGVRVRRSSGYDVLDQAAVATVRRLSGRLARPAELGGLPLRTSIVLRYALDGG
jgi:protein TonB